MVPFNTCASPSHLQDTVLAFGRRLWPKWHRAGDDGRSSRHRLGCQPCQDDFEGLGMKSVPLVTPITTGRTGFKVVLPCLPVQPVSQHALNTHVYTNSVNIFGENAESG